MDSIISAGALATDAFQPVVLDVRWQLGGPPGRPSYESGHIPGARYVDLDTELAGEPGESGRHPLPDLAVFTEAMRRAGVCDDIPVIVYDGGQGWAAARAWWLLRWAGHEDVRVLDGGLAAWKGPLEAGAMKVEPGDFTPRPGGMSQLTAGQAAALARDGLLLDARAAERYRGDVEPIDRIGGHIPGAVSAPTTGNTGSDGRLLPPGELLARFSALGVTEGTRVGVYCGSGVSAAHQVLALSVAGIPAELYVGSWSEWSYDSTWPVAKGPQPG